MWTHTVSDVQIQMTMFIMDHELLTAHYLPWKPCKPKVFGVKKEKDPLILKYQLQQPCRNLHSFPFLSSNQQNSTDVRTWRKHLWASKNAIGRRLKSWCSQLCVKSLAPLMQEGGKLKKAAEIRDSDIYDLKIAWLLFQWGQTSTITSLIQQIITSKYCL